MATTTATRSHHWTAVLVAFVGLWLLSCSRPCAGIHGTATFYTPPYVPSACYGYKHPPGLPAGVLTAAANEDELWDDRRACGKIYKVKCLSGTNDGVEAPCKTGKTVKVMIIDLCPAAGCRGTIDLSEEAFKVIAKLAEGKIHISYVEV